MGVGETTLKPGMTYEKLLVSTLVKVWWALEARTPPGATPGSVEMSHWLYSRECRDEPLALLQGV